MSASFSGITISSVLVALPPFFVVLPFASFSPSFRQPLSSVCWQSPLHWPAFMSTTYHIFCSQFYRRLQRYLVFPFRRPLTTASLPSPARPAPTTRPIPPFRSLSARSLLVVSSFSPIPHSVYLSPQTSLRAGPDYFVLATRRPPCPMKRRAGTRSKSCNLRFQLYPLSLLPVVSRSRARHPGRNQNNSGACRAPEVKHTPGHPPPSEREKSTVTVHSHSPLHSPLQSPPPSSSLTVGWGIRYTPPPPIPEPIPETVVSPLFSFSRVVPRTRHMGRVPLFFPFSQSSSPSPFCLVAFGPFFCHLNFISRVVDSSLPARVFPVIVRLSFFFLFFNPLFSTFFDCFSKLAFSSHTPLFLLFVLPPLFILLVLRLFSPEHESYMTGSPRGRGIGIGIGITTKLIPNTGRPVPVPGETTTTFTNIPARQHNFAGWV